MKAERRFLKAEVRATDGASPKITGHAAKFGVRSLDLGGFVEIIGASAFDACLAENPDILGLFNHKNDFVLGRTTSGTLRCSIDGTGLAYEIDPPDTQIARDLIVSMRRGDIRGSSFGFYCLEDTWDIDPATDQLIRTIVKASIFDVSVVTDPAYPDADSAVRSQFPEGDAALKARAAEKRAALAKPATRSTSCSCDCAECIGGFCDGCLIDDCDADGCECDDGMRSRPITGAERERLHLLLQLSEL